MTIVARELALSVISPSLCPLRSVSVVAETPAGSHIARTVTVPSNLSARAMRTGSFIVPLRTKGTFGWTVVTWYGTGFVTATGSARAARVS